MPLDFGDLISAYPVTTVTSVIRLDGRIIATMVKPSARFASALRKLQSYDWASGAPVRTAVVRPCQFEIQVRRLHLSQPSYESSTELRAWCVRNKNHFYIPEWLLKRWGISSEV